MKSQLDQFESALSSQDTSSAGGVTIDLASLLRGYIFRTSPSPCNKTESVLLVCLLILYSIPSPHELQLMPEGTSACVRVCLCLSVCLSVCLRACVSVFLSVCMSVSLCVSVGGWVDECGVGECGWVGMCKCVSAHTDTFVRLCLYIVHVMYIRTQTHVCVRLH